MRVPRNVIWPWHTLGSAFMKRPIDFFFMERLPSGATALSLPL
jgi:hypothetical protein